MSISEIPQPLVHHNDKGHGLSELAWRDFENLDVFLKIPTDWVCVKRLALSMLALA